MFGRRRKDDQDPDEAVEAVETSSDADAEESAGGVGTPSGAPIDAADFTEDGVQRLDLGGLLVAGAEGMQLQLQVDENTQQVVAAHAVVGETALQLQPFAAPRTEGIWDEVRGEIAAGLTEQGGACSEAPGPFGTELRAQVPVQLPDGTTGLQQVRFLGYDGPRWFLRGVISGAGAVDPAAAAPLEAVFAHTVVVRGDAPMAPRSPIPLRLPTAAAPEGEAGEPDEGEDGRDPLKPFERGPEITEVR